jgi:hypothetical protein
MIELSANAVAAEPAALASEKQEGKARMAVEELDGLRNTCDSGPKPASTRPSWFCWT